jgi:uncharacterized protein YqhQ
VGDSMEDLFNTLLLLAGIPFVAFILIVFAYSAYSPISIRFMSAQKKKELDQKLDEHDRIEENNPELFNALEKMKTYRIISFVFILSYLILFALFILGVSQKELF